MNLNGHEIKNKHLETMKRRKKPSSNYYVTVLLSNCITTIGYDNFQFGQNKFFNRKICLENCKIVKNMRNVNF